VKKEGRARNKGNQTSQQPKEKNEPASFKNLHNILNSPVFQGLYLLGA
jgi:hypothetical protein